MSVVGAAVLLAIVVVLMIRYRVTNTVPAIVCVLFGLVLGATPIGDQVNAGLTDIGGWLAARVQGL